MLKVDEEWLCRVEKVYPGIRRSIEHYEMLDLPLCPECGSLDTAAVSAGLVGRSIHIGAATTKMRLLPNAIPEDYYCNACGSYFGGSVAVEGAASDRGSLLLDPKSATAADIEEFCRTLTAEVARAARSSRSDMTEPDV